MILLRKKHVKITAQIFVFSILAYCLYHYVEKHWGELAPVVEKVQIGTIVKAVIVCFLGYFLRGLLWTRVCFELAGRRLSPLNAFRICSITWMGHYVPGKVWTLLGKAYLSAEDSRDIPAIGVAVTIDTIWLQISGLLLVLAVGVLCPGTKQLLPNQSFLTPTILLFGVIGCHPRVFVPCANAILKLLRQPILTRRTGFGFMLFLMIGNMLTYILWASGFAVILSSLYPMSLAVFPTLLAVFSLAWVSGFIILFAPAGLGVRDSILGLGLRSLLHLEPSVVITAVVASRLLTILVELLCFCLAMIGPRVIKVWRYLGTRHFFANRKYPMNGRRGFSRSSKNCTR